MTKIANFGQTFYYVVNDLQKPKSLRQLKKLATQNYTVLGGGHSFVNIDASDGKFIDMSNLNKVLDIDLFNNTVTVESGIHIYTLEDYLKPYKRVLTCTGSTRGQTVGGASANCINSFGGTGITQFCSSIISITHIDKNGKLNEITGSELFKYAVHLGCLCGIVYSVKLKISDKTFGLYGCSRTNINTLDNTIQNILLDKTDTRYEFLIWLDNSEEFSTCFIKPYVDNTGLDETKYTTNYTNDKTLNNFELYYNGVVNNIMYKRFDDIVLNIGNKIYGGVHNLNLNRNNVKDKQLNIDHMSKITYRPSNYLSLPITSWTFIEFYIPAKLICKLIYLLKTINIRIVCPYIQLRVYERSNYYLCPSYNEDVCSVLLTASMKEINENMNFIHLLNFIGVRWHWGENHDSFYYDGYIERVYSKKVSDEINMICKDKRNIRSSIKKALKRVLYKNTNSWTQLVECNLRIITNLIHDPILYESVMTNKTIYRAGTLFPYCTFSGFKFIGNPNIIKHTYYTESLAREVGFFYMKKGGFIDISHLRDMIDIIYTLYVKALHCNLDKTECIIIMGDCEISLSMSAINKNNISLIDVVAEIAYLTSIWTEVKQFCYQSYSAYSIEDIYSNLLGINIGKQILKNMLQHGNSFESTVDECISDWFLQLGVVSTTETINLQLKTGKLYPNAIEDQIKTLPTYLINKLIDFQHADTSRINFFMKHCYNPQYNYKQLTKTQTTVYPLLFNGEQFYYDREKSTGIKLDVNLQKFYALNFKTDLFPTKNEITHTEMLRINEQIILSICNMK